MPSDGMSPPHVCTARQEHEPKLPHKQSHPPHYRERTKIRLTHHHHLPQQTLNQSLQHPSASPHRQSTRLDAPHSIHPLQSKPSQPSLYRRIRPTAQRGLSPTSAAAGQADDDTSPGTRAINDDAARSPSIQKPSKKSTVQTDLLAARTPNTPSWPPPPPHHPPQASRGLRHRTPWTTRCRARRWRTTSSLLTGIRCSRRGQIGFRWSSWPVARSARSHTSTSECSRWPPTSQNSIRNSRFLAAF